MGGWGCRLPWEGRLCASAAIRQWVPGGSRWVAVLGSVLEALSCRHHSCPPESRQEPLPPSGGDKPLL